ncbi:hypothetical protein QAD02_022257 [Eretmocerus hayati]|uniref:Uncharacterized protein n=1 Tax=Eretmocerus hayati TaxID=131215 RepID=A0ACC2PTL8_9HYME|nr:hypothetical protein QAD02_022257 [Eretmocerus hayati]
MAWTHFQKVLALMMVITGTFNTLSVKYADILVVPGQDGEPRNFKHPFMQSAFMFLGEMMCLLVFKIAFCYFNRLGNGSVDTHSLTKGSRTFNPLVLAIPAICDMTATSIMYVGLTMTNASSFQMLRGAVIVFTGLLSVGFLNKKLGSREWTGIIFVILGLSVVGISDVTSMKNTHVDSNAVITGDLLIIIAQIIQSIQMVVEEKYVAGLDIPALQAVGWEGVFGLTGICLVMLPLNFIHAPPPFVDNARGTLEASIDALIQIGNSGRLFMAIVGIVLSIALFNFSGISVTKELSATTRMILDSVRTITIWAFSLLFRWQEFNPWQLVGFTLLLTGMSCYNNVVIPQLLRKCRYRLGRHSPPADAERVVNTAADEYDGAH